MGQQGKKLNGNVLTILSALGGLSANAATLPRAQSDFNMVRLFQIQSGGIQYAALRAPADFMGRDLQVRFKKEVALSNHGIFNMGASCSIRALKSFENGRNTMMSSLPLSSSRTIKMGSEYHVQNIRIQPGKLSAELANPKSFETEFEMHCSNPKIHQWSVTSFEMHNGGLFELRSSIQRDPAADRLSLHADASQSLGSLQGSTVNGYFGSGLPGTSGVQLLFGSNLNAFADSGNRVLWMGKRCAIYGEESASDTAQYIKDSKFAFQKREVDQENNRVRFHFRNWSYESEGLTVECNGSPSEVASMTTAQVEADLNQSIHFYNKN